MKRFERHIFHSLIAGLFLVSTAGVYLTVHYCSLEDFTDVFLFTAVTGETCEHHANEPGSSHCCDLSLNDPTCCKESENLAECCSNTVLYISVEDEYLKTRKPELHVSVNTLPPIFGSDLMHDGTISQTFSAKLHKDHPPGKHYGKVLLHLNMMLLL